MSGLEVPPLGGSTGLSHEHSAAFDEALQFLATAMPNELPSPLISGLEQRFGLTTLEALEVDEQARRMRVGREPVPAIRFELETIHRLNSDGSVSLSEAFNAWSDQGHPQRLASLDLGSVPLARGLRSQGVAESEIVQAVNALAKLRAARGGAAG